MTSLRYRLGMFGLYCAFVLAIAAMGTLLWVVLDGAPWQFYVFCLAFFGTAGLLFWAARR